MPSIGACLVAGVLLAAPASLGSADPQPEVVFTFADREIIESSGLAIVGDVVVTVNDSGDSARVFAVDGTGATAGVTTWDAAPVDIEALAPAGEDAVWVGDVGDNATRRDSISVTRVTLAAGGGPSPEAVSYELAYPDGAHDAESLLAHPQTGRLYVASKDIFGGTLYVAPSRLDADGVNRLTEVGSVMAIATDAGFAADGDSFVVRGYGDAVVYGFPSLEPLSRFRLPDQQQGEGLAVTAEGDLLLSTEGLNTDLLRVPIPAAVVASASAQPSQEPSPRETVSREGRDLPETTEVQRSPWPWFLGGFAGLGGIMVLMYSLRRR
jgi:hypothetical protein